MKKFLLLFIFVLVLCGMVSNGYCFIVLGDTYTVPEGSTFNQTAGHDGYLVGTLNVDGTYNLISDRLWVNTLNISGTFNKTVEGSMGGHTWFGGGTYGFMPSYTITPTGQLNLVNNANGGTGSSNITNNGTITLDGGSLRQSWWFDGSFRASFTNNGTVMVNSGYLGGDWLVNDGIINFTGDYNYTHQMDFNAISNLDISNGIVTDISGVPGLIMTYDSSRPENAYLNNTDYLLSEGGLLTQYHDVVAATPDQSYYYTTTGWGPVSISFDYWWEMGMTPPPYQSGLNFDVLALQGGDGWQYIGQFDAYNSSTDWATAVFSLPGKFDPGTQLRFVLNDYYPESNPIVYLRNISITYVPEPTTLLLLGLGLIGLAGVRRKFKK